MYNSDRAPCPGHRVKTVTGVAPPADANGSHAAGEDARKQEGGSHRAAESKAAEDEGRKNAF